MNLLIQPVLNFTMARASSPLSVDDFLVFQEQILEVVKLLQNKFGREKVLETVTEFEGSLRDDMVLLWFVFTTEEAEIVAASLDDTVKQKVVLFNYSDENPLRLLERTGFGGLVTQRTINSWVNQTPKDFHKMGQGHGLYGFKQLFDSSVFDPSFLKVMMSENYCIFYSYEIHDLDKLLLLYLERLSLFKKVLTSV